MNEGSQLNKESGVSNERWVPAEQRSQGSQMNKGSQLNKESGVSDEQGASAERLELTIAELSGKIVTSQAVLDHLSGNGRCFSLGKGNNTLPAENETGSQLNSGIEFGPFLSLMTH